MLEIFALIWLSRSISKMVKAKNLRAWKYVLITVLLWVGLEFTGALVAALLFGEAMGVIYLGAILGAVIGGASGYFIARNAAANVRITEEDVLDADLA